MSLPGWFAAAPEELVDHLRQLVAHPTVANVDPTRTDSAPFDGLHATLRTLYPRLHATCELTRVGAHGLLFRWVGTSPDEPLILMAHQDVVPVDGQDWTTDPFDASVVGDYLIGRGTIDDKGALLTVCESVEALLSVGYQPSRDVWLLFSGDEEVDGGSARVASDLLRERGVHPWLVLDEGGAVVDPGVLPGVSVPVAMIGVAEKGTLTVRLTATDEGGHASTPRRGGATARIARAIVRLDRRPFPARLDAPTRAMLTTVARHAASPFRALYGRAEALAPLFARVFTALGPETAATARTTVAVTQLAGSSAANVLAMRAEAVVNLRLAQSTPVEVALAHLRRAIKDPTVKLEVLQETEPSPVSRFDDDRWDLLVRVAESAFTDAVAAPYTQNGATDSRHFSRWCDHVYRFAPLRLSNEDRARLHAANERVRISTLAEGVLFMTSLITEATA